MTYYLVYFVTTGALVSVSTVAPVGLDAPYAYVTSPSAPDATHVWDASTHALVTVTERTYGQLGVFHEELTSDGWCWYYLIGNVAFLAADPSPTRTTQPTIAATKTYVKATGTDEQFRLALEFVISYRDKLATSLAAAGVADPTTNTRYQKCQALIANLGAMV